MRERAITVLAAVGVFALTFSVLDELAKLPPAEAQKVLAEVEFADLMAIAYDWTGEYARAKQLPPGHPRHHCDGCEAPGNDPDWSVWANFSGRGGGKTRSGAEWVRSRVESGQARRIALVAETAADCRDVLVEGESGILAVSPPSFCPKYEPSKRRLTWPNGVIATCFSGDKPGQLRGPQFDTTWIDELAKYRFPTDVWDQAEFSTRLGDPRIIVTTTPRAIPVIKALVADPDTHVTVGSTYENKINLAAKFIRRIVRRYEGTRLGKQELLGLILEDIAGAIVAHAMIEKARVKEAPWHYECGKRCKVDCECSDRRKVSSLRRIMVGVDPAATSGENANESGIVAVSSCTDADLYVLADRSAILSPAGWAGAAIDLYDELQADRIIAEINNGGEMVESTIRQVRSNVSLETVHASRGKHIRFEPVGALYEQGRVHHVGSFPDLEAQVCAFTPEGYEGGEASPDRADALVWAATPLIRSRRAGYVGSVNL